MKALDITTGSATTSVDGNPSEFLTGTVSLRRAGKMHHIMVSRKHKRTPVILIIDDLDIRVVNKTTGELLRDLKLNPEIGYQPLHPKT